MSPKERYWELFDNNQRLKSLPKGFTDQAGLFDQDAISIAQELSRFSEVPTTFPDNCPFSQQDIARIDKETQDIHWALNYPASVHPALLETTCRQINRNGDACAVYNRLPRIDQEKMDLQVIGSMVGKPAYVLEKKAVFPGRYTMDIPYRPNF